MLYSAMHRKELALPKSSHYKVTKHWLFTAPLCLGGLATPHLANAVVTISPLSSMSTSNTASLPETIPTSTDEVRLSNLTPPDGIINVAQSDIPSSRLISTSSNPNGVTTNIEQASNVPQDKLTANTSSRKSQNIDTSSSMVESLTTLSNYYVEKTPTNEVTAGQEKVETTSSVNEHQNMETSTIDATKLAPLLSPQNTILRERLQSYNDSINAPRCQGEWVAPDSSVSANGQASDYLTAIEQAKARGDLTDTQLNNGLPLYAVADYAYYDNDNYVELAGDVTVVQAGQLMTADAMTVDIAQNLIGASGNVVLSNARAKNKPVISNTTGLSSSQSAKANETESTNDSGLILVANQLAFDGTQSASTAKQVAFASTALQAHGYADTINIPKDGRYELDDVVFSTCPPDDRKWQLESRNLDLDTKTGRGEAYDATFRLGNVPVFYLPYFNFPIDDRRTSGLLTPSLQLDSESGLQVSVPYYLNLAPQYDATVTADIFTNRNPMLTGELRYLTEGYGQGSATATYLPNDRLYEDQTRRGFFFRHDWQPEAVPRLTLQAVYNTVSDADYLNDFDTFGFSDNPLNLPRRVQGNYYNDYMKASFKAETFQSLDAVDANGNPIADKDKPYSRLPALSIDYRLPWLTDSITDNTYLSQIEVTGTHDSGYFKKSITDGSENEKSGVRMFNALRASYPLRKPWGHIVPEVSIGHLLTAYDEDSRIDNEIDNNDSIQSVLVPKLSVDAGLDYYQAGSPLGYFDTTLGGYQTLSPRLKYVYAPYKNQNDLPNFNTRIASVSYDQLFADHWFLGHDRLPDANTLTAGINYRYIDAMGITRFDASLGNQFYVETPKVSLSDTPVFEDDTSGWAWQSSTQPYRNLWLDFNGAVTHDYDFNFLTAQFRYHPTESSLLNLGYIKRFANPNTNQDKLSAITTSAIFPISSRWRVMAQAQFDTDSSRMVDATLGAEFEDCCYGLSIYGRRHYNGLDLDRKPNQVIMFEFRINGLGNSSSRFSRLLSNKILGFDPVNTLWKE